MAEILPSTLEMTNPRELEILKTNLQMLHRDKRAVQIPCGTVVKKLISLFLRFWAKPAKPQLSLISQYVRSVYLSSHFYPP